jgi:RimJ/RimL family protein N-acetyltransferase
VDVELRPVTEAVLARLVTAALHGATADEVTPPLTPGPAWTDERVAWLRAFHRDRRAGLDGVPAEATWAVVTSAGGADGDRVVGAVRLRRTDGGGVLEAGIWLTRDARGRGVGRTAVELVLDRARGTGASVVRAETTPGNTRALAVLRALGFAVDVRGGTARAELSLRP